MKWTSIDQCLVAFEKRYQRQHQHQHQQHRSTNGVPIELLNTHTQSTFSSLTGVLFPFPS